MKVNQYATALLLLGIAISRNGDDKRVIDFLVPELLEGMTPSKFLRAVKDKDRDGVVRCLATFGVLMQENETAVDAILRTHLMDAKAKASQQIKDLEIAWKHEEELALKKSPKSS